MANVLFHIHRRTQETTEQVEARIDAVEAKITSIIDEDSDEIEFVSAFMRNKKDFINFLRLVEYPTDFKLAAERLQKVRTSTSAEILLLEAAVEAHEDQ